MALYLGCDAYPWYQYHFDTLFFNYRRCGSRYVDSQEFADAMKTAAYHLHAHFEAGNPVIACIIISWCQRQGEPSQIRDPFCEIDGIESFTLYSHDHFDAYESSAINDAICLQYHPSEMQKMANRGDLCGYPFKPLPGAGEGYTSDEDGPETDSDAVSEDGVEDDDVSDFMSEIASDEDVSEVSPDAGSEEELVSNDEEQLCELV
ncbi:hypothetical protein BKA65DRAFT_587385 [Rhexocercosporidium sp. MPI-PUGE-AT-0058]|nr:hypothetical protein BKA65DRAFT_587385 [Rhexocercosporidium sp. MPI-PUGE-AT-0058]